MTERSSGTAVCWLRNDLRSSDNPALAYALRHHRAVLCLYIDSAQAPADPPAADWWRYAALLDLAGQLDGRLLLRSGDAQQVLAQVIEEFGAEAVYWNREYQPAALQRDRAIKADLKERGLRVASFPGNLLFEPWEVLKADDSPYRVFTPFYKAAMARGLAASYAELPTDFRARLLPVQCDLALLRERQPQAPWAQGFAKYWQPTRTAAEQRLAQFREQALGDYAERRNRPDLDGCSRLSPYLHVGQLGPREIAAKLQGCDKAEPYLRELLWREFAVYILYHWPHTLDEPMDKRFEAVPWQDDPQALSAWQQGRTGIPLVDAGMRELWQTGFMHNRVRMVVASFLTKHLLIDWREGARWFMYTLLDADQANNSMGWQWSAGSGVDAAPYFRIFNPVSQGERFDPNGDYVRRWVPELARLPDKYLNQPWAAPAGILEAAQLRLGDNYPRPLIDLAAGRKRALQVWEKIKGQ